MPISSVARNWPWELLVHHEADSAAKGVTPASEPEKAETSAVAKANPSASLHKWEWPTFQMWGSLESTAKKRADAVVGLPGVKRDGGRRKIDKEPERPDGMRRRLGMTPDQQPVGTNNHRPVSSGVGGGHSSDEAG